MLKLATCWDQKYSGFNGKPGKVTTFKNGYIQAWKSAVEKKIPQSFGKVMEMFYIFLRDFTLSLK